MNNETTVNVLGAEVTKLRLELRDATTVRDEYQARLDRQQAQVDAIENKITELLATLGPQAPAEPPVRERPGRPTPPRPGRP